MDDGQPIGPTEELYWEASRKWVSTCSWLGIQDVSRKVQGTSQEPGPQARTVTHTTEVVCGLVSQDWCYKVNRLIQELVGMENNYNGRLDKASIEYTRGFWVYVARTYRYMNPYLKELHLTLDSWRPFSNNKGWKM